jgi:formylglycine-generating enzyme required for sulfatase activity
MIIKFCVLCAVMVLSINYSYAAEDKAKVDTSTSQPKLLTEPASEMKMVFVKGGCYKMGNSYNEGDPGEKPVHEVCVDDFYIGTYEVTQRQWKKIMGSNPSHFTSCGDDCPIEKVNWSDVQEFISKINRQGNNGYRLPTEAEWEYAARSGGKSERYPGGNDVLSVAWFLSNSENVTHPVGTKQPNGLGLYDMAGNVWEWTNDWFSSDYYSKSPRNNPKGPDSGERRVARGGCLTGWTGNVRVAKRTSYKPDSRYDSIGFRLVKNP